MADFLTATYSPARKASHATENQPNPDRYPKAEALAEPGRLVTA